MAIGSDAEESSAPDETAGEINAFLVADVRGYTTFTQERGDEAAARLTARFAGIVREHVEARDGSVIELRGDEALAVFRSLVRPSGRPLSCRWGFFGNEGRP